MLALYIIFGAYFAVCLVCSVLAGLIAAKSEFTEDKDEGTDHPDGFD